MKEWTEETVYHEGDRFFSDLCRALSCAQRTLDLETYIFDRDALGKKVLHLLKAAARRGVRVRLLLDGVGSSQWSYPNSLELERAGIQVKFYHPLPWQNPAYRFWRFFTLRRAVLGLGKLNRRNHRKVCVVDQELAFLGGMNITARHLTQPSGAPAWRDTSVRIRGESISVLTEIFEDAWTHTRNASLPPLKDPLNKKDSLAPTPLRLNLTSKQRRTTYEDLIHKILNAEKRIWITNPYFVPDLALLRALRFAAWTGKNVRILVPRKNDVWGLKWATQAFYFILLSAKVQIFEYSPSVLHAKIVLIDDWATVGSSNLNHRSLLHDLEVDAILTQRKSIDSLETQFLADLSASKEINLRSWKKRSFLNRVLERLVLVFRRWL